jgi:hypothetical protein
MRHIIMIESLKASLTTWSAKTSDRVKLQHAYIIAAFILLVCAGIIGLLNYSLGQTILFAAIISAALFLINAITWSLLQSAVLSRISPRRSSTSHKK